MTIVAETATLVHGYTMADITRITRVALSRHPRSGALIDHDDRYDAAWHAIVEELYTRPDPPTFHELLCAALAALDQEVDAYRHHHGIRTTAGGTLTNRRTGKPQPDFAPRFESYWLPVQAQRTDGFTDRIVEALALPTVLGVLTDEQYEAIATLAAYDNDMGAAAAAVGMGYRGFQTRVHSARKKVKEVWFEGEPVQVRETGETCRSGHSRAEFGRPDKDGRWRCRRCKRASNRRHRARGYKPPARRAMVT